jgi:kynurenine formamidase
MPRFHFDVREKDRVTPDEVGVELESVEAAEREAIRKVTGIGHDSLSKDRASEIEAQVKDNKGFLLLTVTVSVVVRRTVRALA